jgi:putative membrane protein
MVALGLALLSPIDAVGSALFAVHMLQHLLLMNLAAPLLILGMPPLLSLWILPHRWRRPLAHWWRQRLWLHKLGQWCTRPLVVWSAYGATLWIWHAPLFYEAAIRNELIHRAEHSTFLGTALLFWWILIYRRQSQLRIEVALLLLFTTALHSGLLGALLTFASRPLYRHYLATAPLWGLTALTDQQLAGTLMWIPVGFLYLGTIVGLVGQWLTAMNRQPPATRVLPDHTERQRIRLI